jgi:hypothetical protein
MNYANGQRHVLVLASLNNDSTDLSGNFFPEAGRVESSGYQPDTDIEHGLYGTLWGQAKSLTWVNTHPSAQWKVVRVENNDEIIHIDKSNNLVKFRSGEVVFSGDKYKCEKYISTKTDIKQSEDILFSEQHTYQPDEHLLMKSPNTITETHFSGSHAINVGASGTAKTSGFMSHALVTEEDSNAVTVDNECVAVCIGRNSSAICTGEDCLAVAKDNNSLAIAGKRGIAVSLGLDGTGSTGKGGILILSYIKDGKIRVNVGYAGKDIQPDTVYKLNTEGNFEVVIE